MNVLHALWCPAENARLHLWIESSETNPLYAAKIKTSIPQDQTLRHPGSIRRTVLPEYFSGVDQRLLAAVRFTEVDLWLPSDRSNPLFSESHSADDDGVSTRLKKWRIETLSLSPVDAFNFLTSVSEVETAQLKWSQSVFFLKELTSLISKLIDCQGYIPILNKTEAAQGDEYWAKWQIPKNILEKTSHLMLGSFPHVLLSQSGERRSPKEIIESCLNVMLDALLRQKIASIKSEFQINSSGAEQDWVNGLIHTHGLMQGSERELAALYSRFGMPEEEQGFRLVFRLEEPQKEKDKWRLCFQLQDAKNPSLMFPLAQVWKKNSPAFSWVQANRAGYREKVFKELGVAALVFPLLSRSLKCEDPFELLMNAREAYDFLRQDSLALKAKGFRVLIPKWWHEKKRRATLRLNIQPIEKEGAGMGMSALLDYDWEVIVGKSILSLEEFKKIVLLKMPLVKVRGEWIELRLQEIENILLYFQERENLKKINRNLTVTQALQVGLQSEISEVGLPISEVKGHGWVQSLLATLDSGHELDLLKVPDRFQGVLRAYQQRGYSWLVFLKKYGFGACLADDMGLGKTIQILALLAHERRETARKKTRGPSLLICPMTIVSNWNREINKFVPFLKVKIHHGSDRVVGQDFSKEIAHQDLVITTYQLAMRDQDAFQGVVWESLILDEAQNIKNESAKQTIAIKKIKAESRFALTGTPIENRLSELWSIMDFLNPGYLGTAASFKSRFVKPIEMRANAKKTQSLKRAISPFVLRRLKTDSAIICDLPEKLETKVYCDLTDEQATLYAATLQDMLLQIEQATGIQRRGLVLSTLVKLKQICNHPRQFLKDQSELAERSGKLNRICEMMEEVISEDDHALVFTQYVEMGHLLQQRFTEKLNAESLFLHGGLSKKGRDEMIEVFQNGVRDVPILILSVKAGGVGLNLTKANHVFHYDRWWNPAVENQATDRAHRIGQNRMVQVHKFICAGSFEEKIDEMIERKAKLAEDVILTGEAFLTEISTDELKEILTLKDN